MPSAIKQSASQGSSANEIKGKPEEGWTEFSNGLIMQWGVYDPFNSPNQWQPTIRERVTFPKPFPNSCVNVWPIPQLNAGTANTGHTWFYATNVDKTGFNIQKGRVGWIALGY